jgi:hypothetical protein
MAQSLRYRSYVYNNLAIYVLAIHFAGLTPVHSIRLGSSRMLLRVNAKALHICLQRRLYHTP